MKKLISIIAAITIASTVFAQSPAGLKIGAGVSVNPYKYTKGDYEPKVTDGYNIFVAYPIQFSEVSAVSVGLRWEQTFNFIEVLGVKESFTRGFISLPIKYEAHFGGFFFNVGPTLSFWALFNDTISDKEGSKGKINMFNKAQEGDKLNRLDVGVGAEVGYDWKHIRVFAGYDYGLLKGIKASANPETNFNRQDVRLGVAFIF